MLDTNLNQDSYMNVSKFLNEKYLLCMYNNAIDTSPVLF